MRNLQPFHEAGVAPDIRFRASDWNTILQFVADGLGVTVAPASAATVLPSGAVALPLGGTHATSALPVAHRTGDDHPLVRAFVSLAARKAGR